MEKILENLIEDGIRISKDFANLATVMQKGCNLLSYELDICGWEIQKSINNVKDARKFVKEYYEDG